MLNIVAARLHFVDSMDTTPGLILRLLAGKLALRDVIAWRYHSTHYNVCAQVLQPGRDEA